MRHRADRVHRAARQIDAPITIKIHREFGNARGHELRPAAGTGKTAQLILQRRLPAQLLQVVAQFAFKKSLALAGIGVLFGKGNAERRQSVQHFELALVLTKKCFHAQHTQHISAWYTVAGFGAVEFFCVFLRKGHTGLYALCLQKPGSIGLPVFGGG